MSSDSIRKSQRKKKTRRVPSRHPLYNRWRRMIQRCHGSDKTASPNYKGRGIQVCARWRESFWAFVADVGTPPTPAHQLDRFPNPAGHYEPGNVRWATAAEQGRNKRTNRLVAGKVMADAGVSAGLSADCVYARLRRGWPEWAATSIPKQIGPPVGYGPTHKHFQLVGVDRPPAGPVDSLPKTPQVSATDCNSRRVRNGVFAAGGVAQSVEQRTFNLFATTDSAPT